MMTLADMTTGTGSNSLLADTENSWRVIWHFQVQPISSQTGIHPWITIYCNCISGNSNYKYCVIFVQNTYTDMDMEINRK